MPLTLAKIASNTAHVTFQYVGESVTVEYYPNRITEKVFAELQTLSKMSEDDIVGGFHSLNDILVQLIKSWDVYEDEAQTSMFPLDTERLAELPPFFRTEVLQEIMGDVRPNPVTLQA